MKKKDGIFHLFLIFQITLEKLLVLFFILFILYIFRNIMKEKNNQQIEYNVL
jgi:flagellar biogenesis protein FliO